MSVRNSSAFLFRNFFTEAFFDNEKNIDLFEIWHIIPIMKSKIILSVICFLILFASVNAQQMNWITDFAEASRIAAESGKPMLLDFSAGWCGPCRNMEKDFWIRTDVAKLSEKFVCVKIDSDKNKELLRQYGVMGIPNVTLTDPYGNTLDSNKGYGKSSDVTIIAKLNSVLRNYSTANQSAASLETTDVSELAKYANDFQQQKSFIKSNEFFERILKFENAPTQREIVLTNIGYNYLRANRFDEAIKTFESIQNDFQKGKQTEIVIYGEFLAYKGKGEVQKARQIIDKLKNRFPKSVFIKQAEQLLLQRKN